MFSTYFPFMQKIKTVPSSERSEVSLLNDFNTTQSGFPLPGTRYTSVMVNLDHVCLDNQSHYSLDVTEFQSVFTDTIGMNGKCHKLNPTSRKMSVTSLIKQQFFGPKVLFSVKHVVY